MDGLEFQAATSRTRTDPARADIACFAGFVPCRNTAADTQQAVQKLGHDETTERFRRVAGALLPADLVEWWIENAWLPSVSGRRAADLLGLLNVPVPVETFDAFNSLFAWQRRPLAEGSDRIAATALGAAVRRFFAEGGRKCYVIRLGDPWPLLTSLPARAKPRERILETFPPPNPADRSTWLGVAHLFGLPDVSFLAVPDLPDLFALDSPPVVEEPESPGEERFVECAARATPLVPRSLRAFPAPRCDEAGFRDWAALVTRIGALLERHCREAQFIASVPLPVDEAFLRALPEYAGLPPDRRRRAMEARLFASRAAQWRYAGSIQTAFVQLVYPWLRNREALLLPGTVEAPDAMVAGMLASGALTRGAWRSAARQEVSGVFDLEPILSNSELNRELPFDGPVGQLRVPRTLRERVSVITPDTAGFHLLSDVTTDDDEAYRPANVNRLVACIVRAARLVGQDAVFANNGEALWRGLRSGVEGMLLRLWGDGALAGRTSAEAFTVRCDRSTMGQSDIDAGRVIARVQFTAASPIERITVVLAMDEGGQISVEAPA